MTDDAKGRIEPPFDPEQFRLDLEVVPHDLQGAFLRQASLFAYYAERHVAMTRQEARAKMLLEVTEAKVDKRIRDEAAAEAALEEDAKRPRKAPTENQVAAAIARDPAYIKALYAYNEARGMTALAFSAVEAFRQRRDMLIQLGASQREELKGELRAYSREETSNALRDRFSA